MSVRGRRQQRGKRGLGIIFLIFSLVHTPLPQPDFHNIRHHDAPGEVCDHHDHLLRWHPAAGNAQDVATLHWHWFLPTEDGTGPLPSDEQGPALHAHVADWLATTWDDGPRFVPDTHSQLLVRTSLCPQATLPPDLIDPWFSVLGPCRAFPTGATTARPTSPLVLLERWLC
ncbi:hypothetical protein [Singulisphaera acidiphila]|uniref:Uncharacterized protein n=1 Tax=Singulisphaera acidiphila (strain ATCC BAA-1392 / DSM 18658 / VKM B-2454 / MOB10) TaxID=886293 RepID=L0DQV5_SINAD|nr:hypothetical protein [Singulisphaera acidiphila]AGA31378.1 hypothetical protein Sinac_7339 [Singulisphaera acidiphila DSM 18658]